MNPQFEQELDLFFDYWDRETIKANQYFSQFKYKEAKSIYVSLLEGCFYWLFNENLSFVQNKEYIVLVLVDKYLTTSDNLAELYQAVGDIIAKVQSYAISLELLISVMISLQRYDSLKPSVHALFSRTYVNYLNSVQGISSKIVKRMIEHVLVDPDMFYEFIASFQSEPRFSRSGEVLY